jgi:Leucine-rich repeat (LRR) protein
MELTALREMTSMVQLGLSDNSITDIGALSKMTSLEYLFLSNNEIEDIGPLARLQNLAVLRLENNSITDVSVLRTLPNFRELGLAHNDMLYDIQPLLANQGIGAGDELDLRFTHVPCADIDELERKGVTMLRVTALNGSACAGRRLQDP